MHPTTLHLNTTTFNLIKMRSQEAVSVYTSGSTILRIGPKETIEREIKFHKRLEQIGFPVAVLLEEGELQGEKYYVETSLGEQHLGDIFVADWKQFGKVQEAHLQECIDIVLSFAKAQLNTAHAAHEWEQYCDGIHVPYLYQELPEYQRKIEMALDKMKRRLAHFPSVFTHGDLTPHNICPKGVIDFEASFQGVLGHDIVTVMLCPFHFPRKTPAEFQRSYEFPIDVQQEVFSQVDALYSNAGFPKVSECKDDFFFVRSIWSVVRMDHFPLIQKWRYEKFIEMLDAYLEGRELTQIWLDE